MVSLLAAPVIIRAFDWQSVFYIFGSVGFVWLAAWLPLRIQQSQQAAQGVVDIANGSTADASSTGNGNGSGNGNGVSEGTSEVQVAGAVVAAREAARAEREAVLKEVRTPPTPPPALLTQRPRGNRRRRRPLVSVGSSTGIVGVPVQKII